MFLLIILKKIKNVDLSVYIQNTRYSTVNGRWVQRNLVQFLCFYKLLVMFNEVRYRERHGL